MSMVPSRDLPSWADDMVRVRENKAGEITHISGVGHKGEYWDITRESPTTWKISIQREHSLFARIFGWHRDKVIFRLEAKAGEIEARLHETRTERD